MVRNRLADVLGTVGTAAVRPRRFFDESDRAFDGTVVLLVVVAYAFFLAIGMLGLGYGVAASVDATITVDNPSYPGDSACSQLDDGERAQSSSLCDEPATIERDIGEIVLEVMKQRVPGLFFGVFFLWLILGALFHVTTALAGGSGDFGNSLSVAAWSFVPTFVQTTVTIGIVLWTVASEDYAGSVAQLTAQLETSIDSIGPSTLLAGGIATAWQWYIVTYGLANGRDLPLPEAAAASGIVVWGLFALSTL